MQNKFVIKTTKPQITIGTTKATKMDVVVNKPIIDAKRSKAFFKLKNTGGRTGAKGDKGDPGQAATITAGTATSLPAGSNPTVVNSGTSTNAVFNFGIPKGDKGDTGDTGAPGQAATISVGSTTTGAPGTNASVTNVGTSSAAVLNFTVPRGATGATGAPGTPGAPGQAATVNVGTTTTGAAGTSASVTNSGTSSAAVLNFTIPKGDKGDTGSAATVTVGNTTTGNPGTNASVVNTGTSSAAVLDFTIPKGAKGDPGNPGTAATIAVGTTSTLPAGSSATVTNSGTSSAAVFDFGVPKGDKGDTGNPGSAATVTVGTVTTGAPGTNATVVNSGTSSAAVFDFTIPRGDKGESGSGTGDMLASDYDPNGTVQNAGGIVDYVGSVMPTVNDATLTIQQNGTTVDTFTANASSNVTANITVPTKTSDLVNDGSDGTAAYLETDETAYKTASIPYGQCDNTSTATVFTATVPGVTELRDGVCMWLKNGVVTSASGFTININGLGAKPVYSNMSAASRETTLWNVNYTMFFVYDSTRVDGGCWILYRGYNSDNNTIGYQLRTNSQSLPMSSVVYRYRLLFTSADGTHYVPANNSTSTDATASRTVCQDKINPFGRIFYYGATASVASGSRPAAANLWEQYAIALGYSFNRTGAALTLTSWKPVYLKCAPQTDGSAIIDSTTPYVQDLPTTEDGKIYIFLGIAYSATNIELQVDHPVYYYKDGVVRPWTNATAGISSVEWGDITGTLSDQTDLNTALGAKADTSSLAAVATSGLYSDLSGTPTIPAAQVNSDWNANSGVAQILNKPTLATVATSGSYNDLSNLPTIPTVNNATLTIQKNGTTVKTFTANASANVTANITVPTKTSDLSNDSGFIDTVDTALSATSVNPVQNKAVAQAINDVNNLVNNKISYGDVQTSDIANSAVTSAKIDWTTLSGVELGWKYLGEQSLSANSDTLTYTLPAQYDNYKVVFYSAMASTASDGCWIDFIMYNGSTAISVTHQVQLVQGTTWTSGTNAGVTYAINGQSNPYAGVTIKFESYRAGVNDWRSYTGSFASNNSVGGSIRTSIVNGRATSATQPTAFTVKTYGTGNVFNKGATIRVWASNNEH